MLTLRTTPTRAVAIFGATCFLFLLAACDTKSKATPENFTAGLNAHFADHPDCLFAAPPHFPYETSDPAMTKQLNALAAEKLLTVEEERQLHVSRYTTTDAGARVAPRFCYGHRVITSIDSSTPPAPANGFPETQVTYHYTLQDVPVWAKSDAMRAAFPALAVATSGTASSTATMAGTMAGWQVPD